MNYKSSTILKVNGSIIKEGTYTSNDGTEVTFTPELIQKIFSKVNDHVPLYLTHENAENPTRKPSGYAYKVGLADTNDDLKWDGFVFDRSTMEKVAIEGYDSGSAEIDFEFDAQGAAVDGTLTGIALVPNPAITGTNITATATVFSRQTDKNSSTEDSMTEDITTVKKQLDETRARELKFSQELEDEKVAHAATKALFEKQKGETESIRGKYKELLGTQVTTLATEVKGLGFSAPEKLTEGLEIDQQVAVLQRIKEQFSSPGMVPPKDKLAGDSAGTSGKKAFSEALKELGLSEDEYTGKTGE